MNAELEAKTTELVKEAEELLVSSLKLEVWLGGGGFLSCWRGRPGNKASGVNTHSNA